MIARENVLIRPSCDGSDKDPSTAGFRMTILWERSGTGLNQTAHEIFAHVVKEDRSGCMSSEQRLAGVRQLAATVEQRITDALEDSDLS